MISTYIVADFESNDKTVEVTYINEENFEYKRTINIPHLEDGSVDEDYFKEILEGQLRGVENKFKIGMIEFKTSDEGLVGIASTSVVAEEVVEEEVVVDEEEEVVDDEEEEVVDEEVVDDEEEVVDDEEEDEVLVGIAST